MRPSGRDRGASGPQYQFLDRSALAIDEAPDRQASLAAAISSDIVQRLSLLHAELPKFGKAVIPVFDADDIDRFAHLVLGPDGSLVERRVCELRERGFSLEPLFVDLFGPVARRLGRMWDEDECDFVDVTRGMGRLQHLVATTECDFDAPAPLAGRSILMSTLPGEQHSLGISILERALAARGWRVRSERPQTVDQILAVVSRQEFAVVGLSVSRAKGLEGLARTIFRIRSHSRNGAVGVMVGGPALCERPDIAASVGADATATDAGLAALAAQKLFTSAARRRRRADPFEFGDPAAHSPLRFELGSGPKAA